jgi:hypothetical protein
MADNAHTSNTVAEDQAVGKVVILYGTVKAIAPDGTERFIVLNSPVFADEKIVTDSEGRVSISINNSSETQLDLGRMSTAVLDQDVIGGVSEEDITEAAAEVEQIQAALLEEGFDPTVELEAPAAGTTSAAGGGHPTPEFARTTHEGLVTSGAETTGFVGDTIDPIPGAAEAPAPTISVQVNADGGEIPEGEDAFFTVTINDAIGGSQLNLNLISGTADSPSDYNAVKFEYNDGTGWLPVEEPITLKLGDNTFEVRTDTVQDTFDEPDENFTLNAEITNGDAPVISDSAVAIIVDGDEPVVIVSDETEVEGDNEVFTVTVNNVAEGAQLTLGLQEGTADDPADYHASIFEYSTDDGSTWHDISGSITLSAGKNTILVRTDTVIDDEIEGEEEFYLTAEVTNEGGDPVFDTGLGTIIDGTIELTEPVSVVVSDDHIPEGDDGTFTVTVNNAPENAQLNLDLSEGTADDPADYNAVKFEYNDGSGWQAVTGPIDISAGSSSLQVRTDTVDDAVDEPNESFFVNASVSSTSGILAAASGTGVILDNDEPPPPNSPPVANPDAATTPEDTPISINVTGNDTDPDNNLNASTAAVVTGPTNGTLVNNGNGTFTYTPNPEYNALMKILPLILMYCLMTRILTVILLRLHRSLILATVLRSSTPTARSSTHPMLILTARTPLPMRLATGKVVLTLLRLLSLLIRLTIRLSRLMILVLMMMLLQHLKIHRLILTS